MVKKETNKSIETAAGLVNNIKSICKVDEMIEKLENYELNERVSFAAKIYAWETGDYSAEDKFVLNSLLSPDDQEPLRKIIIAMLKEKRKEYISDLKNAAGSLEKLAKEVLNE